MPMVVDILANITLIVRVFIQKRRAQQAHTWGQQRRMMLQLLCLSGLYTVGWLPSLLVEVIQILRDPTFLADVQTYYFGDLVYTLYLFFPWICLGFFPELVKWIKKLCRRRPARNVVGTTQPRTMNGTTL
ncbi:unnamed protein product [Adineta steineri]|uniref:G-protein coupled receptors family 1 profile domain-containing protein n=1 Tax=Adineta steineri TaxID=433720 RepID=A0A818RSA8_9BILA|nr:unnamed protein product [Adineta steineri]CAF3658457.1 unnamed protein product [Adineta steineri]